MTVFQWPMTFFFNNPISDFHGPSSGVFRENKVVFWANTVVFWENIRGSWTNYKLFCDFLTGVRPRSAVLPSKKPDQEISKSDFYQTIFLAEIRPKADPNLLF